MPLQNETNFARRVETCVDLVFRTEINDKLRLIILYYLGYCIAVELYIASVHRRRFQTA